MRMRKTTYGIIAFLVALAVMAGTWTFASAAIIDDNGVQQGRQGVYLPAGYNENSLQVERVDNREAPWSRAKFTRALIDLRPQNVDTGSQPFSMTYVYFNLTARELRDWQDGKLNIYYWNDSDKSWSICPSFLVNQGTSNNGSGSNDNNGSGTSGSANNNQQGSVQGSNTGNNQTAATNNNQNNNQNNQASTGNNQTNDNSNRNRARLACVAPQLTLFGLGKTDEAVAASRSGNVIPNTGGQPTTQPGGTQPTATQPAATPAATQPASTPAATQPASTPAATQPAATTAPTTSP